MLSSKSFIEKLRGENFDFFTGVPCSLLSGLIASLETNPDAEYIPSVREDVAVGLCAGVYMAGRFPVALMQNSGLGYCLNALTSLNLIYQLPLLIIMSWRGFGGKDAPEHIIMGDVSEKLLETAGLQYAILTEENVDDILADACRVIKEDNLPFTILVKKGMFDERH